MVFPYFPRESNQMVDLVLHYSWMNHYLVSNHNQPFCIYLDLHHQLTYAHLGQCNVQHYCLHKRIDPRIANRRDLE